MQFILHRNSTSLDSTLLRLLSTRDKQRHGQLSIEFRSHGSQTWTIKWSGVSSKQRSCRYCYMNAPHGRWLNGWRKSLTASTQECCEQYWTNPGDSTPQSSSYTATYHPSRKLSRLDEPDKRDTAGEVGTSSWVMYSCGPLHMDEQRQDDQLEPTYSSSVPIRDVGLKICWKQWTIGRGGERGSGISVLIAWHDDDDDDIYIYCLGREASLGEVKTLTSRFSNVGEWTHVIWLRMLGDCFSIKLFPCKIYRLTTGRWKKEGQIWERDSKQFDRLIDR